MEKKSLLDGVEVVHKNFPLSRDVKILPAELKKVGTCPRCGSPIFGPEKVKAGDVIPVQRTCSCNVQPDLGVRTT